MQFCNLQTNPLAPILIPRSMSIRWDMGRWGGSAAGGPAQPDIADLSGHLSFIRSCAAPTGTPAFIYDTYGDRTEHAGACPCHRLPSVHGIRCPRGGPRDGRVTDAPEIYFRFSRGHTCACIRSSVESTLHSRHRKRCSQDMLATALMDTVIAWITSSSRHCDASDIRNILSFLSQSTLCRKIRRSRRKGTDGGRPHG